MHSAFLAFATLAGLALGIADASANKITYEQAVGACQGRTDPGGNIACTKCGTINDRTCTNVVIYQCEGKNCTTRVRASGPSRESQETESRA